jgi:transposase
LQDRLKEHGVSVGIETLWRFFKRRKITRKNRRRMPQSNVAAQGTRRAKPGSKVIRPRLTCH